MATYIYIRVSGSTSAESGLSEESQLAICRRFISENNLEVGSDHYPSDAPPGVFVDRAVSGRTAFQDRPAGFALSKAMKPGDNLVFYNVERSFRSVRNWSQSVENWLENDIKPNFVQQQINFNTATGRLMGNILAALAQYYSDIISQRMREANAIRKLRKTGKVVGGNEDVSRKWENSNVVVFAAEKRDSKIPGTVRIYNRVSALDQKLSGLGMDVQRNSNVSFANRLIKENSHLTLHDEAYEDESVSAFKLNLEERPNGKKMLADLKPGDHVVVYRCDRAFRQPAQAVKTMEELAKRGVTMHLVCESISSDTPMGRLWITALATFASIESQIKSERNSEITENQRKTGRPFNQRVPPYARVVKALNGGKQFAYDKEKMIGLARAAILRHVGFSRGKIQTFIQQSWCHKHGLEYVSGKVYVEGFQDEARIYKKIDDFIRLCNEKLDAQLAKSIFALAWIDLMRYNWKTVPISMDMIQEAIGSLDRDSTCAAIIAGKKPQSRRVGFRSATTASETAPA